MLEILIGSEEISSVCCYSGTQVIMKLLTLLCGFLTGLQSVFGEPIGNRRSPPPLPGISVSQRPPFQTPDFGRGPNPIFPSPSGDGKPQTSFSSYPDARPQSDFSPSLGSNKRPHSRPSSRGTPQSSTAGSTALDKGANAVNDFGLALYKNIRSRNVFYSPLSLSLAMGMVYAGAEGETAKEMARVLGYETSNLQESEVAEGFRQLLNYLNKEMAGNEMNIANGVFISDKANLQSTYAQTLQRYYNALVEPVNFANKGEDVRRKINAWVEDTTRGQLTEFYSRPLSRDTIMAVVNAVYFKGKWAKPFNRTNTVNDVFYNNGEEPVSVPMMFQSTRLRYNFDNELGVNVLIMPYVNDGLDMIILFPEGRNHINTVGSKLNSLTLNKIVDNSEEREVRLGLPKFTLQEQYDVETILQLMGIRKLFSQQQAELTKIATDSALYVSKVSHKSKIEVNEEGTTAAGGTGIDIVPLSLPELFKIDRPFLFIIRDNRSKVILFIGQVNQL